MFDPSQYPGRPSFVTGGAAPQGGQAMAAPQGSMPQGAMPQQANAMLQAGASTAPTGAWTAGMSRIANALMGGYQKSQMNNAGQPGAQGVPVASPISPGAYGPQMGAVLGTGSSY